MSLYVSEALYDALIRLGVSQSRIDKFDQHSSIELHFKNITPIILMADNNLVWLKSELTELNDLNINFHAGCLFDQLQCVLPWVVTGQAGLGKANGNYEVKALLEEECIESSDKLYHTLNCFYYLMTSIHIKLRN